MTALHPLRSITSLLLPIFVLTSCAAPVPLPEQSGDSGEIHWYDVQVVAEYPHDPDAFIQGLIFRNGSLYESTGRRRRSDLRQVVLENGEVLRKQSLYDSSFCDR